MVIVGSVGHRVGFHDVSLSLSVSLEQSPARSIMIAESSGKFSKSGSICGWLKTFWSELLLEVPDNNPGGFPYPISISPVFCPFHQLSVSFAVKSRVHSICAAALHTTLLREA